MNFMMMKNLLPTRPGSTAICNQRLLNKYISMENWNGRKGAINYLMAY